MSALEDLPDDHDLGHLFGALAHVTRWDLAIDGGAHRGIWARVLARKFRRVLAFEPCASNRVRIPNLKNVRVSASALGAEPGTAAIADGPENTGQAHLVPGDGISIVPLDALELPACGFLKLDVEGYELFALRGARELLSRTRPVVLIEENGLCRRYGVEPGAAAEFLVGLGMHEVARFNKDHVFAW